VYGDLDGDRRPEAVVVVEQGTQSGSTGQFSGGTYAVVYGFAKGAPVQLGSIITTGTPVGSITIAKGVVTITSGPANARSTQSFRRSKGDFVEITPAP
jgi:2-keto-4-pentenoate hydratase/2-oxohepta-3-ene-1,7-dioic acid hydratase in catechol pathway